MVKLGLGTVQLGVPYGVANKSGKPDRQTALAILRKASEAGITCFDTASSYGDSEGLIGEFLAKFPDVSCQVSTKISAFRTNDPVLIEEQIREEMETSLARLGGKIDYLLFHRASDLITYGDIAEKVIEPYQQSEKIGKVGVSVYTPEEAAAAMEAYPIAIIQIPVNALDHRFLASDMQAAFARHGLEVHTRSAYLQGLLCMEEQDIPYGLTAACPYIRQYSTLCRAYRLSQEQTAFAYVRDLAFVDYFFIGCESLEQLEKNIAYLHAPPLPVAMRSELDTLFADVPIEILNPSLWKSRE